jgi:peroxiredoxin (alkyl hydroperoxide reductase subunit C)
MHDMSENGKGPILGARAPFFEAEKKEGRITLDDFKGSWVILFSHPDDVLPIFKTRTINYILCKRRIKAVAVGRRHKPDATLARNFLNKYMVNHVLTVIDDVDERIARRYGLYSAGNGAPEKGVFVIDSKGYLRMKLLFPLEAERNFSEILKVVDALQSADRQGRKKKHHSDGKDLKAGWSNLTAPDAVEK